MDKRYGYGKESDVRRRVKKVALAGGAADAFAFTWQNPEDKKIIIDRVMVDEIVAGGTATAVLDVGVVANATSTAGNLIDGMDANAVAVYDNIDNKGTNGKAKQKADEKGGANGWVTGKILTAAAANLAGNVYIFYLILD